MEWKLLLEVTVLHCKGSDWSEAVTNGEQCVFSSKDVSHFLELETMEHWSNMIITAGLSSTSLSSGMSCIYCDTAIYVVANAYEECKGKWKI